MIIFGTTALLDQLNYYGIEEDKKFKLFNLSSIKQAGFMLNELIPPVDVTLFTDEKEFDIFYANYILQNDSVFIQMMTIMHSEFEDLDDAVNFILVERDDYRDILMESLIKFIQQRYGYDSYVLNDIDDYISANAEFDTSRINIFGVEAIDVDKERYLALIGANEDQGDIVV